MRYIRRARGKRILRYSSRADASTCLHSCVFKTPDGYRCVAWCYPYLFPRVPRSASQLQTAGPAEMAAVSLSLPAGGASAAVLLTGRWYTVHTATVSPALSPPPRGSVSAPVLPLRTPRVHAASQVVARRRHRNQRGRKQASRPPPPPLVTLGMGRCSGHGGMLRCICYSPYGNPRRLQTA